MCTNHVRSREASSGGLLGAGRGMPQQLVAPLCTPRRQPPLPPSPSDVSCLVHHCGSQGWAVMRPDIAIYITAGYLVLVAIGYSLRPSNWKTLPAEPSSGYKGLNLAVMLFKDPVRFLQVVYNTVQIVLCSYMVSGAAVVFIPKPGRSSTTRHPCARNAACGHCPRPRCQA